MWMFMKIREVRTDDAKEIAEIYNLSLIHISEPTRPY